MMLLLRVEWMRFVRYRPNLVILALASLLLLAAAVSSGLDAAQQRREAGEKTARWEGRLESLAKKLPARSEGESAAAARAAFDFARGEAPPALRPALGGLALGVRQFAALPADVRVSVDSRHLDGRKSDVISNPLLHSVGMPDFSVVVALLVPLVVIALGYGLVQEAREQGTWRLVCTQSPVPWKGLAAGCLVRFMAVFAMTTSASLVAFGLDPGASLMPFLYWTVVSGAFCLTWFLIVALTSGLRISSTASALGLLAVWLFTTFAVPPALSAMAEAAEPMPSRLEAMIEVRKAQSDAEAQEEHLLKAWYADNPEHRPASIEKHAWPVSAMQRYEMQDSVIVPLMAEFERKRAHQASVVERFAWLSPGLAVVMTGDRLAGADAQWYARYAEAVDRFEVRWRAFFVPRIMNYRGLSSADLENLPKLQPLEPERGLGVMPLMAGISGVVLLLLSLAVYTRKLVATP
jgi:ABC-2 type transport system permease protein